MTTPALDFDAPPVRRLRADLALALRAAAHHGLAEGVCNHFSIELPDGSQRFLLNPRGLLWAEVQADDIVLVDFHGHKLAGRHEVEPTAMFIHAAVHRLTGQACVLHTHMPYATALTLTQDRNRVRGIQRIADVISSSRRAAARSWRHPSKANVWSAKRYQPPRRRGGSRHHVASTASPNSV